MQKRWTGAILGGLLVLAGVLPGLVSLLATAIAGAAGCRLDEGLTHRCMILGLDWGDALGAMFVMFWFELLTIWLVPIGLIAMLIGTVSAMRRGG